MALDEAAQCAVHAAALADNWHRQDLIWDRSDQPPENEHWCLIGLETRDSDPEEQRKARQMKAKFKQYLADGTASCHRFKHWAYGWIESLAVKVWEGKASETPTPAFRLLSRILTEREQGSVENP